MAFDFVRRRQVPKDWSCGLSETSESSSSDGLVSKLTTAGIIALATVVLVSQPSGKDIQRGHYENWKRKHV